MSAEIVDSAASDRVLVFGSLPPEARDLDLLVRPADERALAERLASEGFVRRGREWARFRSCSAEAVELVPADRLGLAPDELDALFSEALPLAGFARLARPAPHHVLLLLARRLVGGEGRLDERRAARLERALAEAPDAWERAEARAPAWRAARALRALEQAHTDGTVPSRRARARALADELRGRGKGPPEARLRSWRTVLRPHRRGAVVAFSGLDGSGKTSQAAALTKSLERLGYESAVEWTRLSYNPSLDLVAYPVKSVLRLSRRVRRQPVQVADAALADDPGKQLRRRSALVTHAWAAIVALANGWSQRRATRRHLRRGRVVACDRYTLDSAVHLRYRYGERRHFRVQGLLVRLLSPRPLRAYFLEVPPETALARKAEQYDLAQLALQARLYGEEHERVGARRLDGERPAEELCAEIARDVWLALG